MRFEPVTLTRLPNGAVAARAVLGPGVVATVQVPREVYSRYIRLAAAQRPAPPARAAVSGELALVGDTDVVIGSFFGDLAKGFSKVVKNKWVKTGAAAILSAYGVPPGVTTKAMEAAGNAADLARGDPGAAERLRRVGVAALGGNPTAQRAVAAVEHVERSRRQASAAVELVEAAAEGNAQARQRLAQIADGARRNDPRAVQASRAVRAATTAMRRPPPPVVTAPRQPAPPARALRPGETRVVSRDRLPDGRQRLTIDVAG